MADVTPLIASEELRGRLGEPSLIVLDCRFDLGDPAAGSRLYRAGHIPGAVYADLDRDLAGPVGPRTGRHPLPAADAFATTLGRLGIGNDAEVVVYDQSSGALAARAWWLLRWAGHDRVRLLDGGFSRWVALGYEQESGDVEVEAADFRIEPRPELVLGTAEIVAAGARCDRLQLVDARDRERFAGDVEPIDPVAGHIPGALNRPFGANLGEDGRWKAAADLQRAWQELLGDGLSEPWSVMCGSGVTACHHVVSALVAGVPEPRVYVGSWSEWIRDTARPLGRG